MGGELARPKAETVVVLGGENHAFHPSFFEGLHPLAGVELGWVEAARILVAFAPLFSAESVWPKVDEPVIFHLVPGKLTRRWGWSGLGGGHGCGGKQESDDDSAKHGRIISVTHVGMHPYNGIGDFIVGADAD